MPESKKKMGKWACIERDNAACRTEGLCAPQRLSAAESLSGKTEARQKQQGLRISMLAQGAEGMGELEPEG